MNTGIICNCLAHLKPIVRRHMPCLTKFVSRGSSRQKTVPVEPSNGHSYGQWRGDTASHGYQLHSVGRSQKPSDGGTNNGIVVIDEIQVEITPSRDKDDASSTEEILRN